MRKGQILPRGDVETVKYLSCGRNIVQQKTKLSQPKAIRDVLRVRRPPQLHLIKRRFGRYCDQRVLYRDFFVVGFSSSALKPRFASGTGATNCRERLGRFESAFLRGTREALADRVPCTPWILRLDNVKCLERFGSHPVRQPQTLQRDGPMKLERTTTLRTTDAKRIRKIVAEELPRR